jgi:hypothetical protein
VPAQQTTPVELAAGLYRWQAQHPDWRPPSAAGGGSEGWDELVGCVLYETDGASVLIDPLLPLDERERLLRWLDDRTGRRRVSVLTTVRWHRRDREPLVQRYRASTSRAVRALPPGVVPKPLRGAAETVFWLERPRALVLGDCLLGDGSGGVRVCPEGWLSQVSVDRRDLAELMAPLLELDVEMLLVSHGAPVVRDGRSALARALREAQQG